ncbi:MAG: hypothetical protein ACI8ZM_002293 [Crocinitomix sp.]
MEKSITLILAILFTLSVNAQKNRGAYAVIGLNRIGVLYEFGAHFQKEAHSFNIGARFYGPDLVFEKNYPGINLGYDYTFREDKKMRLLLGACISAFYENKVTTNLWVFDPKLRVGSHWDLNQHIRLNLTAGFGTVINKVETSYTPSIETYTYLNYELALGLTYHFRTNPND